MRHCILQLRSAADVRCGCCSPERGTPGQGKGVTPLGPAKCAGCLAALPGAHVPLHHSACKLILFHQYFSLSVTKKIKVPHQTRKGSNQPFDCHMILTWYFYERLKKTPVCSNHNKTGDMLRSLCWLYRQLSSTASSAALCAFLAEHQASCRHKYNLACPTRPAFQHLPCDKTFLLSVSVIETSSLKHI